MIDNSQDTVGALLKSDAMNPVGASGHSGWAGIWRMNHEGAYEAR